ncbi:MAG TPA: fructose-specific PTS transporter subunit EIIC [Actinotalea sp.]|nr:fructose-specific PTS transporter subunit EIIC [Actinotalea sp.]
MKFVAVSSCPTGIAHTYMAAEALEQAAAAAGHECVVETQGAAGSTPLDPAVIAAADGVIFAADLEVQKKERFAGKPTIDVGVKKAVHDAPGVIAAAVEAVKAGPVRTDAAAAAPVVATPEKKVGVGTRIRQWLMTGVSYMLPFVVAGGILIGFAFMLAAVYWGENGAVAVTEILSKSAQDSQYVADYAAQQGITLAEGQTISITTFAANFGWFSAASWATLFLYIGGIAFGFLVSALSAYIAYAIADRPGIVPGFVGGVIAANVGAGFLGGILTGFLAGGVAWWMASRRVPKTMRGMMPILVIPLFATLITGAMAVLVIGPPMKAVNDALTEWLNGLGTSALIPLGIILGLMMCFDLGGPVNKVAYTFAATGLVNALAAGAGTDSTEARIMSAVMAAGMVPPLAIALATVLRGRMFSEAERESGKSAWFLGASFISEGAIPFAAADPLRMLPSFMVGGAVTGGLVMALGSGQLAPHGGIWILPLIGNPFAFVIAVAVGMVVSALAILVAKNIGRNPDEAALESAESISAMAGH